MARNVVASTVITRARRYADIENATLRFPDAELIDYANMGLQELVEHIRATFGQDYFIATNTINTVAGTSDYALPGDFLSLIAVDMYTSPNVVATGRPYMQAERNFYRGASMYGGILHAEPFAYRLLGSNIRFYPVPTGVFRVDLTYAPVQPTITATTDVFDGVEGWDDFVACHIAGMCAIKDENFDLYGIMEQRKAAVLARIMKMAGERDQGAPERVQDVYLSNVWDGGDGY